MIATLITLVMAAIFLFFAINFVMTEEEKENVLTRIQTSQVMNWGTKADTRLFGLIETKTGSIQGFDADIAREVTKRISPTATAVLTPVTSANRIQLLKNGNIDAVAATMSATPEREKIVDFSDVYFNAGQSLLVRADSGIDGVDTLNSPDKTIIATVGSTSIDEIKSMTPKAKILALPDHAAAVQALKAGQGDAFTTDNGILYGISQQNPELIVVGGNLTEEPYRIAVDRDQEDLLEAINRAIEDLKNDGTYDRLIKKWFGEVPGMNLEELRG
jgi:putative glutamine transport system substrate-binding protein